MVTAKFETDYFMWDVNELTTLLNLVTLSSYRSTELIDLIVLSLYMRVKDKSGLQKELKWKSIIDYMDALSSLGKYRKKDFAILGQLMKMPQAKMEKSILLKALEVYADFDITNLKEAAKEDMKSNLEFWWDSLSEEEQRVASYHAEQLGITSDKLPSS
jgi:hypothetical protein